MKPNSRTIVTAAMTFLALSPLFAPAAKACGPLNRLLDNVFSGLPLPVVGGPSQGKADAIWRLSGERTVPIRAGIRRYRRR